MIWQKFKNNKVYRVVGKKSSKTAVIFCVKTTQFGQWEYVTFPS